MPLRPRTPLFTSDEGSRIQGLEQGLGPQAGQLVKKSSGRVLVTDRDLTGQEDVAGIHALIHLHNRDAGLCFAADDGPLDGGGSAVFGQQGAMDVDGAKGGEIEEAAMIDGASRFEAFIRVIVPIMWPGIIATSLFTLVLVYHEFLLVRILTLKNWTLAVAMQQYLGGISDSGSLPLKSAAAVSAALPLLIVILFYQKHLIKGLTAGAVKE